jgi:hypothetical protein
MTAEHFDQLFEQLHERRPFAPFTVELVGGERFEVDQPHATVVRNGRGVFLLLCGIPVWFDHKRVLQVIEY